MAIIDKTNNKTFKFRELTPGVYRCSERTEALFVVTPESNQLHRVGELDNNRIARMYLLYDNGNISVPYNHPCWDKATYTRLADTVDFVIPGT